MGDDMTTEHRTPYQISWSDHRSRWLVRDADEDLILEFFGESDAKLFATAINRQADLVDSLHRIDGVNEELKVALDQAVEALTKALHDTETRWNDPTWTHRVGEID